MAKKRVHLGSKNFFTITVLSVAVLFTLFMSNSFLQQKTSTQSEATGVSGQNLSICTIKVHIPAKSGQYITRDFGGGVQLFNGNQQSGDSRVLCAVKNPIDPNRPYYENYGYGKDRNLDVDNRMADENEYMDIWGGFKKKTNSLSVIADAGCITTARLYESAEKYDNLQAFATKKVDNTEGTKPKRENFQLSTSNRDKATAVKVTNICAY